MRPNTKFYKNVVMTKRWERIENTHYLVSIPVSNYIRKLENQCGMPKEEDYVAKRRWYNRLAAWWLDD